MNVSVLYGTESGNAELVADEVAEALGGDVDVRDLQEADVASFDADTLYLVICSTHGEGDLPESAQPFADAFTAASPDLTGVTYAMFGLGDSTYENYSRGSEHIDALLAGAGARRVGEYGRHDAASRESAVALATAWAEGVAASAPLAALG